MTDREWAEVRVEKRTWIKEINGTDYAFVDNDDAEDLIFISLTQLRQRLWMAVNPSISTALHNANYMTVEQLAAKLKNIIFNTEVSDG